tara:strand:- start:15 stop:176 length:162 start_codon:yes stop_codon:yes gene_type:complete
MSPDQYRIDWALQCVHEYSQHHGAYCYLGSFAGLGITAEDSNAQAIAKLDGVS